MASQPRLTSPPTLDTEIRTTMSDRRKEALEYHEKGRPGKIEVVPTKAVATARDLSLAYSPGVAEPCLEINKNPEDVFRYTARGNLVAPCWASATSGLWLPSP